MRRRNAHDYQAGLISLLPPGLAWTRRPESVLGRILLAEADSLAHIEAETFRLMDEANPLRCDEALDDWRRVCGLPDECSRPLASREEQRAAVIVKLNRPGGQNAAYYQSLAAAYGETIEVEEIPLFIADAASAGDNLNECPTGLMINAGFGVMVPEFVAGRSEAGDDVNCFPSPLRAWPVLGEYWQDPYQGALYAWEVTGLSLKRERFFLADQNCAGDSLRDWDEGEIECRLRKAAPAQTILLFGYKEEDYA